MNHPSKRSRRRSRFEPYSGEAPHPKSGDDWFLPKKGAQPSGEEPGAKPADAGEEDLFDKQLLADCDWAREAVYQLLVCALMDIAGMYIAMSEEVQP